MQRLFRNAPLVQRAARAALYWVLEARYSAVFNRRLGKIVEQLTERYIRKAVKDPRLRAAVTPDYSMGCKRILLCIDYPAEHVPCRRGDHWGGRGQTAIRADWRWTGAPCRRDHLRHRFHVTDAFDHLSIVGRDGRKLFLLGSNTGLGHNSVVF
ncbi:hypothetical protein [Saccharopolyspora sp. ASAGF58]|uniref:hypothetical protein n=1 Tax=Saccharopolyspora sp. ASAGF58 TaxID=2719023 RepID=UPI001FF0C654|nr:hypothetical protein [Saccharopolyspora sp. ASAGF58]